MCLLQSRSQNRLKNQLLSSKTSRRQCCAEDENT
jgi:hypothetical protein